MKKHDVTFSRANTIKFCIQKHLNEVFCQVAAAIRSLYLVDSTFFVGVRFANFKSIVCAFTSFC